MKTIKLFTLIAAILFSSISFSQFVVLGNCENGYGTFQTEDGHLYTGIWKNGMLQNGKAIVKLSNGDVYKGNLVDFVPNGYGEMKYADGTIYKGYWKDGKYDGQGEEVEPESAGGCSYKGAWEHGLQNGYGTFKDSDGNIIKGMWKNGEIEK